MEGDFLTGALRETLLVFETDTPGTPLTTTEVQAQLDVGRRSTYDRLDRLADAGFLETKAVGSKGRVWWMPVAAQPADGSEHHSGPKQSTSADLQRPETGPPYSELLGAVQSEVEPYRRILETIQDGVYIVDSTGHITLVNDAFCEMMGYPRKTLIGMHAHDLVDEETIDQARPYWEELFDGTREFARFEADVTTAAGSSFRAEGVFSLLERHDGRLERVGVIRDVTTRNRYERALEHSRQRLAALNDLNIAIQEITHAVLEQSTRTEIEQVVCDSLLESNSYGYAWAGNLDGATETLRVRASAGGSEPVAGTQVSIDPTDPNHCASAARAIVDTEIQVTEWAPSDIERLPWANAIRDLDLQTSADVPLRHESTVYGVLSVYTQRKNGFQDEEAALFGFLGEVIGHAIASVERKRALMSDELLELEFRVEDVLESFGIESSPGELVFDSTIPIGNGTYLTYGSATEDLEDALHAITELVPYIESFSVLDDQGLGIGFEARMVDPPVLTAVSNHGGYLDFARFADGDFYLRIHIAPGTDTRQIASVIRENYPTARLVSQRQITRERDSPIRLSRALSAELTDRQRIVLETAYATGYFDTPRLKTGSDVAKTLDISGPTFHEHLRKALHTFLGIYLREGPLDESGAGNRSAQSGEPSR